MMTFSKNKLTDCYTSGVKATRDYKNTEELNTWENSVRRMKLT